MNTQTDRPTTVSEMFPNKYLSSEDLRGTVYTLVIESVTLEKMRDRFTQQEIHKICLHFKGAKKALPLNKTQAMAMVEISGTEAFDNWVGLQVQLQPDKYRGKNTIRIAKPPRTSI